MRDITERPKGVDAGKLRLVGTDEEAIYNTFTELLENEELYKKISRAVNLYGDGHACERIADILEGKECREWKASSLYYLGLVKKELMIVLKSFEKHVLYK